MRLDESTQEAGVDRRKVNAETAPWGRPTNQDLRRGGPSKGIFEEVAREVGQPGKCVLEAK